MVGIHHRIFSPAAQSIVTTGHPRRDGSPQSGSPVSGTSSLAKVAIAQVYLLLGTIREDKDRSKWELQAEQLRKLVVENGMEVFQKYFIRLVVGNAPTIFPGINRPVTNQSTYQILVDEIHRITNDVSQADKIAEAIDTANEDLFRDFDLSTFMDHFKLNPVEKTILALGFKLSSKPDLRTKADAILSNNFQHFLAYLAHHETHNGTNLDSEFLATMIDRFIQYHPPSYTLDAHADMTSAVYAGHVGCPPSEMLSALYLGDLILNSERVVGGFLSQIRRLGSNLTSDEESCQRALRNMPNIRLDEDAIGTAILYTAISRTPRYSTKVLVAAVRRVVPRTFRWPLVIASFDRRQLHVSKAQFLAIYHALRPLAGDGRDDSVDIQSLWSGAWNCRTTQVSFLTAFLQSGDELDISTIPGLQKSFSTEVFNNADEQTLDRVRAALRHPLSCVTCIRAIFYAALNSRESSESPEAKKLFDVMTPNLDIFILSTVGAVDRSSPEYCNKFAEDTIISVIIMFLTKEDDDDSFALESLWQLDETWVTDRFEKIHAQHPLQLPTILSYAAERSWLRDLIRRAPSGFTLDLTALAHKSGHMTTAELKALLNDLGETFPSALQFSLSKFLAIKSDHEIEARESQILISHSLCASTVFVFIEYLTSVLSSSMSVEFTAVQRKCIGTYPRLVNYNCSDIINAVIDANGRESNQLPQEAQTAMEEHYKAMYAGAAQVRTVLDILGEYKLSEIPIDQDIFACMISGLFDEYYAYQTYPFEALKTTALLFGGVVQSKLLPELTQEIALGMIFEAIRDSPPESNMYKFGLQVLMRNIEHFDTWPGLCRQLIQVPSLRGTDVFGKAEQVVHEHDIMDEFGTHNGINGGATANEIEEILPSKPPFKSIRYEIRNDQQDPPEDIQETVLFVLNNVTDQNLHSKFDELKTALASNYQAWFANHLVEARAKTQQNYHQLYLSLVAQYDSASLWAEVLRETYVSVARMLNAESTEKQANERVLLKNLGAWLGSITLARGQPLRHKNIAFKQLLHEGHHTKRLSVVLPFVCKVLAEAKGSPTYHADNPYILDMLRCLSELYQTNLKLNLKFEIEVLFTHLGVILGDIEPGSDLETSFEHEELPVHVPTDLVDRFDAISMSGAVGGVASGRFSPQDIIDRIPDLNGLLQFPPVNDMVDTLRFHDVVKEATQRAIIDIIAPVVERSVTIAAISTKEMIKKDFATEPDENRVKAAAIHMVKRTAGALALVTSKEPLRASMSNYIRQMSLNAGLALPEGLIILGVNANLDLACTIVEKRAEERAVPEIEEMIELELINPRRDHRTRANTHPFVDHNVLTRWAMTIASPYKLAVGHGLNQDQMAIYDEFARLPRIIPAMSSHGQSGSDAAPPYSTDLLHDSYTNGQQALDNTSLSHLALQQSYTQAALGMSNGRPPSIDVDQLNAKVVNLLDNIISVAANTSDEHMHLLPLHPVHPIIELHDTLLNWLVRSTQYNAVGESIFAYTIRQVCERLFEKTDNSLAIEVLLSIAQETTKLSQTLQNTLIMAIAHQKDESLLKFPLTIALLQHELVDLERIDTVVARRLLEHSEEALGFFSSLMNRTLFIDRPVVLRAQFARSIDAIHQWSRDEPCPDTVKQLVRELSAYSLTAPIALESFSDHNTSLDQFEFIFQEWCSLCARRDAPQASLAAFVHQLHVDQFTSATSVYAFLRFVLERCIESNEHVIDGSMASMIVAYQPIDALALLIVWMAKQQCKQSSRGKGNPVAFSASIISFIAINLNHHHTLRGDNFNQKAFFRLFSTMLIRFKEYRADFGDEIYYSISDAFADTFYAIPPIKYGSFGFAWMSLISHRDFVSGYLERNVEECDKFIRLIVELLTFACHMTKPLHPERISHEVCGSVSKIMVALNHDMPQVLAANHTILCRPLALSSLRQLQNLVLAASPTAVPQPETIPLGLKLDHLEGIESPPLILHMDSVTAAIRDADLQELIDQALQHGPSEDAIAHIAHAIQHPRANLTTVGYSVVHVEVELVDAIVLCIGTHAVKKTLAKSGPIYTSASPDAALLTMLVHELSPEARYYFLNSMFSQLRYVNAHTSYFAQALLALFGEGECDDEEMDIKEQIIRVVLERCSSQWPHPWGLVVFTMELMKNEKYVMFDLPFVKNDFTVVESLSALSLRL